MYEDEVTLADHFRAAGYSTGMFGKWHLGDHYPYRPQDRGFDEVYCIKGGAIGVTADYWNNDYFDDHYYHNEKVVKASGYCTDVFFEESSRFIRKQVDAKNLFLPTYPPTHHISHGFARLITRHYIQSILRLPPRSTAW